MGSSITMLMMPSTLAAKWKPSEIRILSKKNTTKMMAFENTKI